MIISIPELKSRFAAKDKPSAKDFSDFVDTVIAKSQEGMSAYVLEQVAAAIAAITTGAQIVVQPTPPNASHSGSLWIKTDPATGAVVRVYNLFTAGSGADNMWHARHSLNPGTIVAVTDPAFDIVNIAKYDGGGSPGVGAMWEWPAELKGTFLLGASSTYPVNTAGGEAEHALTIPELPAHDHTGNIFKYLLKPPYVGSLTGYDYANSGVEQAVGGSDGGTMLSVGGGLAHNNMPPYRSAYLIRRTTRLDYVEAPGA